MNRKQILEAAQNIVCGDREKQYGDAENNFGLIAEMWKLYIQNKTGEQVEITPTDVGVMMALLKIARIATGRFKKDSYIDCIGYMACAGEIEGQKNGEV